MERKAGMVILLILFIIGMFGLAINPASIKASEGLIVTPEADRVTIEGPLVEIVISTTGVRPIKWTTAEGLELAADAKPYGSMGNRTPLWDWITNQDWPGELCLGNYSYEILESNESVATIRFNYTCSQSPITGLQVVKFLTFYVDKYYFDIKAVLINPTDAGINTTGWWDPNVGYRIAAVEYSEPLTELYQAYQNGETPYLDMRLSWTRFLAGNLRWVAVYSKVTEEIVAIGVYNATNSVWLESTVWFEEYPQHVWGSEICVEFPSLTIAPHSQVTYLLRVYGGPPDFPQLTEAGMGNLMTAFTLSVNIDSDQSEYSPNDTCNYIINLTNGLNESLTNIDVNLTLWTTNYPWHYSWNFGGTIEKIIDVNYWSGLIIAPRSTMSLTGNFTLAVRENGYYCLYAEVYGEGKCLTALHSLILVTIPITYPIVPEHKLNPASVAAWIALAVSVVVAAVSFAVYCQFYYPEKTKQKL